MQTSIQIHLYSDDRIAAQSSNGVAWVGIGDTYIFADAKTFLRLREAIDAYLIANPAPVHVEVAQ